MNKAQIKVEHGWYGCETGCCGHTVTVTAPVDVPDAALPWNNYRKVPIREVDRFFFEHPHELKDLAFAEHIVEMAIEQDTTVREIVEACGGYEIESWEAVDD